MWMFLLGVVVGAVGVFLVFFWLGAYWETTPTPESPKRWQ